MNESSRSRGRLLLATDFDGTIAGIRDDPAEVVIEAEAYDLLSVAADSEAIDVAIVSGRDLSDLSSRTRNLRALLAGSHGLEIADPAGALIRSAAPSSESPPPDWIDQARTAGLRLELKKYGMAVHWRGVDGIDRDHTLIERFAEWARHRGLELIDGRLVLEARLAGANKEGALRFLAERTGCERLVYAGDDLTDLLPLRWAAGIGRAIFVSSAERPEALPGGVETVRGLDDLLAVFREEIETAQDGR
ncbi:MAG TPA: trehalose-phosphatase [Thermoanaerobaculia bacterium]|nr:trehalose-phosphatase [Thermoanaerobaculia bacterium]